MVADNLRRRRAVKVIRLPAALCGIALTGCAPRSGVARLAEPVEVTVWSMWSGQEEKNFLRVLRRFEETHPGIRMRNLGAVSDDTRTVRALVAGVPPDLFTLSDPAYLGPLARSRALRPLDDLFRHAGFRDSDFVPASLELCRDHGQLYGMPYLIDDTALLWDKRAFREAGLDPELPPRTLEELADCAVRLTKRDASGRIIRLGLRPPGDIFLFMALFGGKLVDSAGHVTADDPANVAALAWYKNLVDRLGGIEQVNAFAAGFGKDQGASNPFFVGKTAMMLNGEWNPYWIARYAPQVEYGVAPIPPPISRPDRVRTTWVGGNVFCIPKESRHPGEAWEFLKWTQTDEAQVLFAHAMNNVPNRIRALRAPKLREGAPFRAKYAVFLDLASSRNAAFFPVLPVTSLYMNRLATAVERALLGDRTPAQALAEVRQKTQKELDAS